MKSIESREPRRNLLAIVIPIVLVLAAVSAVLVLTTGGSPASVLGSGTEVTVSTVEADVVLYAPFNGTTASVVSTLSTQGSTPMLETLAAQYRPTGNGSTGVFSSYYGTFDAGEVNVTGDPQGLNLTLTVSYGGISGSGNASVDPESGEVVLPVILGTVPQLPAENMTVANGATDCAALGAAWNSNDDTCVVDVPTVVTSLTIGNGTTLVNDGFLADEGNATPAFTNNGTFVNSGFAEAGLNNYGLFDNYGRLDNARDTINNYPGGFIYNYGLIDNSAGGLIHNHGGGFIYNYGGGFIYNYAVGTINNFGLIYNYGDGFIYNYAGGTINNFGTIFIFGGTIAGTIIGNPPVIANLGTILNRGGLIIINNRYYPGRLIGNQPIGGTVLYS